VAGCKEEIDAGEKRMAARMFLSPKKKSKHIQVLTPSQHIERMDQIDEEGLKGMFAELCAALDENAACGVTRLIVNIGAFQNHPHLHWKAYMEGRVFKNLLARLPEQQQKQYKDAMKAVKLAKLAGALKRNKL